MKSGMGLACDESLRDSLLAALGADERTAYLHIRVGVYHGIAHLAGSVPALSTRSAAQEIAASLPGIRGVINRIEAPGAPSPSRTINLNLNNSDEGG